MKVVWITSGPLPEARELFGFPSNPFGGWLNYSSVLMSLQKEIELFNIFPSQRKEKDLSKAKGKSITYYSVTKNSANQIKQVLEEIDPDIVHVHGTESKFLYTFVKVIKQLNIPYVVSIQGLVISCTKHFMAGLPTYVANGTTWYEFIRRNNLRKQQEAFEKRAQFELRLLEDAKHIIGRTTWDKAGTKMINPNRIYYSCNEILREEFYDNLKWNSDNMVKDSIFVSQASYPLKGFHILVSTLKKLVKRYPKISVRVAGPNIFRKDTILYKIRSKSYENYVIKMIKDNELESNITFLGILDSNQMKKEYLNSNVFASLSSIENSSNSIAEAMILGVPIVSSYVGGIPDMLTHLHDGMLYPYDSEELLYNSITTLFDNPDLTKKLSENSMRRAELTHNKDLNISKLIHIYDEVIAYEQD